MFAANNSELLTYHQIEIPRACPKEGWVEQDPLVILKLIRNYNSPNPNIVTLFLTQMLLNSCLTCVDKTVENMRKLGFNPGDIKAIGITNQRETIVAWDKLSGLPLYNAIGKDVLCSNIKC